MVKNPETLNKVQEIKEILNQKPERKFLCGTEKIQYFDHMANNCLKKYEEIPTEDKEDTLLAYLKETLFKLQREEFSYNQQAALNICQTILERNRERQIASF